MLGKVAPYDLGAVGNQWLAERDGVVKFVFVAGGHYSHRSGEAEWQN
jgi:hypothetical protein